MGFYGDQVLPRLIDKACGMKADTEVRSRVCADLRGDVVELGFGSGLNVSHYPPAVTRVDAVEPADVAWRLAADRLAATTVPVQRAGLDGQRLLFPGDSYDAALSTWTLCTVPDVEAALLELRRVLKPGATFHFAERGLAPDGRLQRWQRRIEPLQKRMAGGCHVTRPVADLLSAAGFEITRLDVFYEKGAPKVVGAQSVGIAVSP